MPVHELIVGMTRRGKTYYALKKALDWPKAIYFNPQDEAVPSPWVRADRHADIRQILAPAPRFINYVPSPNHKLAAKELTVLVRTLVFGRPRQTPLLFLLDEADEFSPQGKVNTPGQHLAQRGAKKNVWGWFLTQYPSELAKSIVRNCIRHTHFLAIYSAGYYNRHGIDGHRLEQTLANAPLYHYMVWEAGKLTGPYPPV